MTVKDKLNFLKGMRVRSLKAIASEAGVSYDGLRQIACGALAKLSDANMKKLEAYLNQFEYKLED